ncbi:MAG: Wzz/FepE/Etk N-terminal domain-containing protein [Bacteroidales bacterium]
MAEKRLKNREFESTNFIVFLWRWKFTLIGITLAAAILAAIFSGSGFIAPKYKANVIMFPASSNSVSKSLLAENTVNAEDIMEFGEEEQAEQMLQILNSNPIRSRVIEKFDLMEHYDIDPDGKYKMTELYNTYDENISYKRTEYMAVDVSVLDTDPEMSARIANYISNLYDSVKTKMQRQRSYQAYKMVEDEYQELRNEVREMEDSLSTLRKMGIHDYESQAERINEELAKQLAKGNQRAVERLNEKLEVLANYGGAYVSLRDQLEYEKKQLSKIKAKYEEAKMDAESDLPHKFIVEEAYVPERKAYPIRWLIVVVSALGAFVLSLMTIIIAQNISTLIRNNKEA